jgi:D-tyrosyl-tRNA(Tyr) deacylase
MLLVGIGGGDGMLDMAAAARKVVELRVFPDAEGKMNVSLRELGLEILAVSQLTLYGDARKGRRPSYADAAPPEVARPLFDAFVAALRGEGAVVREGRFGAHMLVDLVNDGPVTLLLELAPPERQG